MKKTHIEYTQIPVLLPPIDYFIEMVRNNNPFHFIRVNHSIWDFIHFAYEDNLSEFKDSYTNSELTKIANKVRDYHFNNKFYKHNSGEGVKYWHNNSDKFSSMFENILYVISQYSVDSKFKIGLSTGVGLHTEFGIWGPQHKVQKGRTNVVSHIVEQNSNSENFFYSGVTKHYAIMGETKQLIDELNNNDFTIIFLGHSKYSEFGQRYGIKNFVHVEIPNKGAMDTFDEYVNQVKSIHSKSDKTFVFHSCGHILSAYLAKQLEDTNIFAMDVGKSFQLDMKDLFNWKGDWFRPVNIPNPKQRYTTYIKKLRNG